MAPPLVSQRVVSNEPSSFAWTIAYTLAFWVSPVLSW
jgi:hypothetical protein